MRRALRIVGAALLAAALPGLALAQAYPSRTVRILVPFAPGGATDIAARLLANSLEKQYGQPFVVENRPGAFTFIASDAVAKAEPDGYTLLFQANSLAVEAVLNSAFTVSPEKDFTIIAMFSKLGLTLVVNPTLPVHNLKDLVAYAKARPGKLNHGLAASEPSDVAEIKVKLGLDFVLVPYKGGPAMLQALVANDVQFSTGSPQDIIPLMQAGKARPIVYLEKTRHPLLPNVPTVSESGVGLEGFDSNVFFGVAGPARTPPDVVAKLNAGTNVALKEPAVLERLEKLGQLPYPTTVAEAQDRVAEETRITRARLAAGIVKRR